ncbi:hypothetical protein [Dysgonomonas sp. Marseille-P4361]|uniref:hypothetical protein n=1 Tax=Dysgonomonas sp. Marseille-P4361 TaxID=2161820 RepID=UPI000D551105|nr:hypothetical protein [Dysgonomonas sp. Marseille-P4361]
MKRAIYILLLLSVILVGCRAPKDMTSDTKQKEQRNIENNISLIDSSTLDQVVSQALQKAINEKLKIKLNHVEYDTDKPIDPETGERPKKSETNIDLEQETNELETDSTTIQTNETGRSELTDQSKDKSKFEGSEKTKEKKGFTFLQVLGLSVAASLFIGFVILIIRKLAPIIRKFI